MIAWSMPRFGRSIGQFIYLDAQEEYDTTRIGATNPSLGRTESLAFSSLPRYSPFHCRTMRRESLRTTMSFLRNWNASRSISNPSYSVNIVGRASEVAAELFPTEPFRRKLPRRNRLTRITARQSTQEKLWFARIRQSVTQPGSLEPAVDSAPAARGCRFDAGKSAAQEHLVS